MASANRRCGSAFLDRDKIEISEPDRFGAFDVVIPLSQTYQPRRILCDVGCMRLLAKQPIVVAMAANPEPDEPVCRFDCESAVVSSDPSRPEPADLLEVKCGMPRVLLQARVGVIGESPNLGRQGSV